MNQASQILAEVKKAVCGKDRVLIWVLTVILARGHILLEDIPGVGKTTMALAFSRALGLDYKALHGSIRLSLSRYNTDAEIDRVLEVMPPIIRQLRQLSPFGRS